jgi:hypothetical protein
MKNRMILRVEELEQRNTPSCNGLQNALTNPGADHRSDTATEQLQDNMAVQCSDSGHTPGAKSGGQTTGFKSDKTPPTLAAPLTGSGGDCDDATGGNSSGKIIVPTAKIPNGPTSPTSGSDDECDDAVGGSPSAKIIPPTAKTHNGPDSPTSGAHDDGADDFDGQCAQPPTGGPSAPFGGNNHNETLVRDRRKRTKSRR